MLTLQGAAHRVVPERKALDLMRRGRAVLARDRHTCAYCGQPGRTVDHVHPLWRCRREEREANTWENLVTACEPCQRRKGGRTLKEAGMSFRSGFSPHAPRGSGVVLRDAPREWAPFLQPTPA